MANQITYRLKNNEWEKFEMNDISEFSDNLDVKRTKAVGISVNQMDKFTKDFKETWEYIKKDWLGKNGGFVVYEGVFWAVFMTYIFPWLLDIAKVYCAFQVAQSFYREKQGRGGDGRSGFQALVYYGKWYLCFWMVPFFVELIDQIGGKMHSELVEKGIQGIN